MTFESYDDLDFGYLRILVDSAQLRIEYHPASDGEDAKTPDDFVTVELATRKLIHLVHEIYLVFLQEGHSDYMVEVFDLDPDPT